MAPNSLETFVTLPCPTIGRFSLNEENLPERNSHVTKIVNIFQEGKNEEKELDLDELLDVEGELKRKKYLWDSLADCKQGKDKVEVMD